MNAHQFAVHAVHGIPCDQRLALAYIEADVSSGMPRRMDDPNPAAKGELLPICQQIGYGTFRRMLEMSVFDQRELSLDIGPFLFMREYADSPAGFLQDFREISGRFPIWSRS